MSQASLSVDPPVPAALQLLVVPGNHKVRLLAHRTGISHCILKAGFRANFIRREVAARRQATACGVAVPELLEVGADGSWFRERYVRGTPINRLADPNQTARTAQRAAEALQRVYRASQAELNMEDYARQLQAQIAVLSSGNRLLNASTLDRIYTLSQRLACQTGSRHPTEGNRVVTALTHGDFQAANILLDGETIWLIDWEYAAQRQIAFDSLVYSLAARSTAGLADRLGRFQQQGWPAGSLPAREEAGALKDEGGRGRHAALFLLEEMALRLDENAETAFTRLDPAFTQFLEEVSSWLEMTVGQR
jgi:tRNA A-37 threonylcarbamoyl transferase component Bud32